ncbi:hypothetical protein P7C73_g5338, partial [Tremellales sp. Uapishka_1]
MAPTPTHSPVTGHAVSEHYIHSSSLHFQDTKGRSLLLRGINLSGAAKAPQGHNSHSLDRFWEDAEEGRTDWIGRPLDLEDGSADVHLARLRSWGFNFLRYVFTWESLEHQGPGKYDYGYMDYIVKVLYKCKEYGFRVLMDPHQDTWSRFSGGSGAPLWTLYACGIDPRHATQTNAALIHNEYPSIDAPKPSSFPDMLWSTNYTHLLNLTVWTLFFAGKTFAPKCIIDGVNIEDYLQNHFNAAVSELIKTIAKADGLLDEVVLGWDGLNEPGEGLIGYKDVASMPAGQQLKKGQTPTAFEGMRLGMGERVEVDTWDFGAMGPSRGKREVIDPKGVKLWLQPEEEETRGGGKWGWKRGDEWHIGTCIWALHGVWDIETSTLLQPAYFATAPNDPKRNVEFMRDFFPVQWLSYASHVRTHHPEAILFIQPTVFSIPPHVPESVLKKRACTTPHFYDGLTLMTKHWNWFNADALGLIRGKYWSTIGAVRVGEANIRKCIQDQLGFLKQDTKNVYGDYPTIIGEIGAPFDLDGKKAYGYVDGGRGEGDYSQQQKAWDCSLNATDGLNCLNYTMWTYVADNSHQWGDNWNGEDLSIWSADDYARSIRYDESKASVTPMVAQQTISTASSSATLTSTNTSTPSPAQVQAGIIPASLILAGARAIGAVCRPFPIAIVGVPERIDFVIATTTFKLAIRVSAHDVSNDETMTEIYVPYVHYAKSLGQTAGSMYAEPSEETSRANLLDVHGGEKEETGPLVNDVKVVLSTGRYELRGQTLKWFYPTPSSGARVHTIEITRNGGPLTRGLVEEQRSGLGSWLDVCPGNGCSVM